MTTRHTIVMVTTSYPRFPGDTVGTFMEPIARGVAARGHDVHVVAPWHPLLQRAPLEGGVHFHFFRYAPIRALNVFGYASAMKADTRLRASAFAAAPLALAAGWWTARGVARRTGADIVHGHWVLPGGAIAAAAAGRLPLVISLHGSDVYVAERHRLAGLSARRVFSRADWVTACSDDLRRRAVALGAEAGRTEVLPYGVDVMRFHPDPRARAVCRAALGIADEDSVLFTAGRLVRKKGFEYLIEAAAMLRDRSPSLQVLIAGAGDLERDLRARARAAGVAERVRFLGIVRQTEMPQYLAAADIIVVPSVRDEAGNVDGLPNVVMEALASGTPLVTTLAGGIGEVAAHDRNALVVPERDAAALGGAIERLLGDPALRKRLGGQARQDARQEHGWERVAERFERAYERAQSRRPV